MIIEFSLQRQVEYSNTDKSVSHSFCVVLTQIPVVLLSVISTNNYRGLCDFNDYCVSMVFWENPEEFNWLADNQCEIASMFLFPDLFLILSQAVF